MMRSRKKHGSSKMTGLPARDLVESSPTLKQSQWVAVARLTSTVTWPYNRLIGEVKGLQTH